MNLNGPCRCPKCGWLGTIHDTQEYRSTDVDFSELEPLHVCPKCTDEIHVQMLGQKGLDGLRQEYALLLKPGYAGRGDDRGERRDQIERFFAHIGQPFKQPSETTAAFRKMMLSGRMNQLMIDAVQDATKK